MRCIWGSERRWHEWSDEQEGYSHYVSTAIDDDTWRAQGEEAVAIENETGQWFADKGTEYRQTPVKLDKSKEREVTTSHRQSGVPRGKDRVG